jgi:phosphatidylglycerophosphate synthase
MTIPQAAPRRVLRTRERAWPHALARSLARVGATPNGVSIVGVLLALAAGACAWSAPYATTTIGRALLLTGAAAGVQLRLLCNMLDGLLAIEGGMKSALGDIYNDLPDRISDSFILIGAGYAVIGLPWGVTLGWAAALVALMTAYVRVLAGSLGATQHFSGPMAKQHRMFVTTIGLLGAIVDARVLLVALWIIVIGSLATVVRRTRTMAREVLATRSGA